MDLVVRKTGPGPMSFLQWVYNYKNIFRIIS